MTGFELAYYVNSLVTTQRRIHPIIGFVTSLESRNTHSLWNISKVDGEANFYTSFLTGLVSNLASV